MKYSDIEPFVKQLVKSKSLGIFFKDNKMKFFETLYINEKDGFLYEYYNIFSNQKVDINGKLTYFFTNYEY